MFIVIAASRPENKNANTAHKLLANYQTGRYKP